jgi:adenylate cyclase
VPTKLRTVLFTDLAGYTDAVARADRTELRSLIQEHEDFTYELLSRHNGVPVKNLGDSYMCLFESATDALRAGLEACAKGLRNGQFGIRAGCATGDVEEMEKDAFGDAVNMAARIIGKAPAGELWFSESTRLCCNQSEVAWEGVGQFSLKGFPGEQQVYRAVHDRQCFLPDAVKKAVRVGKLCLIHDGGHVPTLPPDPTILLMGFKPGSQSLRNTLASLPVLDPGKIWLSGFQLPPLDRYEWLNTNRGLVIGSEEALKKTLETVRQELTAAVGTHTIIFDASESADMELVMAGLALPAVPMANVVNGYSYDLLADGRWVNRSSDPVLRVDVSANGVVVIAKKAGVELNGRVLHVSEPTGIQDGAELLTPSGVVHFHALPTTIYAGLLVAPSSLRMPVMPGKATELGREPNHPGLALPDRKGQDNVRWCSGNRAETARAGGFTLDRALAGRRQTSVETDGQGVVRVNSLHDRCATWLLRENGTLHRVEDSTQALAGELIVTGTSVVQLRRPGA